MKAFRVHSLRACTKNMNMDETIRMDSKNRSWKPKMLVFDKDGTLGDCTPALDNWSLMMSLRVVEECKNHQNLGDKVEEVLKSFHSAIGWNNDCAKLLPSAFVASGTWGQILAACATSLEEFGIGNAREKVDSWHNDLGDIHVDDRTLIPDLPGFMSYFKQHGTIIAICTADDRKATDACIKNWGLEGLIDYSICGDEVKEAKPSAQPLSVLCKQARVSPQDCIVVGDTSADVGMGRNIKAGLVVGVLSGSGTADQLFEEGAHIVIPDIGYLIGFTSMFPERPPFQTAEKV